MKAVLFDLDDTLYPEIDFVRGGFRAAAGYVARRAHVGVAPVAAEMMRLLEREGRGHVFDAVLTAHGLHSVPAVQAMVLTYRTHTPKIQLYSQVDRVLRTLRRKRISLAIVTDGLASVQWRKIIALGLDRAMDVVVCTGELAGEAAKPSVVPFQVALELLRVDPAQTAYVGNDPGRDFAGPRKLGMLTVRVQRQTHKGGIPVGPGEDADRVLRRFAELPEVLESAE